MKLSALVLVLLPTASSFVAPRISTRTGQISGSNERFSHNLVVPPRMAADGGTEPIWSIASVWRDIMGSKPEPKPKVDSTAAQAYAELRKKVLVKKERQCLEGQLCSLLRISGDNPSPKVQHHVRRLASELQGLQSNANAFRERGGLAGSWKLIYSSAKSSKSSDIQGSVEDILYVSEHYRISHSDTGVLRVYKRVLRPAVSASTASKVKATPARQASTH